MLNHQIQVREPEGQVAYLMKTDIVTIMPDQTIYQALELMTKNSIKRLIVRNENHHVAGMITRSDLIIFFDHFKSAKQ